MVTSRQNIQEMTSGLHLPEGWQVLSRAIPRGRSADVAAFIGRTPTTVRRWRENLQYGSGVRSFLDTCFSVTAALHQHHQPGLRILLHSINSFAASLDEPALPKTDDCEAAARISKESADVVVAMLRKHPIEAQEREVLEAIAVLEDRLRQMRAHNFAARRR